MQNEQSEESRSEDKEEQQNLHEKFDLALAILKEAVPMQQLRILPDTMENFLTFAGMCSFRKLIKDVILKLLIQGLFGGINADVSLTLAAAWILDEIEAIRNQPQDGTCDAPLVGQAPCCGQWHQLDYFCCGLMATGMFRVTIASLTRRRTL